jgi:hypothetical protein
LPLVSFCNATEQVPASKAAGQIESLLPIVSKNQILGAANVAEHIYQNYPASKYIYLYIGQSPTIIYAMFSLIGDRLEQTPTQIALPLSKAKYIREHIIGPIANGQASSHSNIDYFQKLVDHFDEYLEGVLLDEVESPDKNTPRKLLLIDYTVSGESLGGAKQAIDYYLRYKSQSSASHRPFLTVKSEYFAMANFDDELGILKSKIDAAKLPYPEKLPPFVEFAPVDENGQSLPNQVDMKKRIAAINQNTTPELWHWRGEVFDLSSIPNGKAFIQGLMSQSFDDYSPYGSWDLRYDPVSSHKDLSKGFMQLLDKLGSCSQPQ